MALVSSQPLLNGPGRRGTSRRLVAGAIAAVCAVAALALIATAVGHFKGDARRSSMLQRTASAVAVPAKAQALADEVPMMAQPVYYVPLSSAPGAGGVPVKKEALAQPRPVIYYYVPESSIQNLAENATAATNATAAVQAKPEFKCTAAHLVEVSNEVMPKWDKCKESSDYVVPNKDAKRRLMGWVWEGNGDPNLPMPMMLANGTNASAGAAAPKGEKLADCEAKALGDTCVKLEGCANPVCSSYYNEPEIERLCGVCTMKVSSWFGCFAKDAMTVAVGRGVVAIGDLKVGDAVMSASGDGSIVSSRVYYIHDHKEESATVRVSHDKGMMELTPTHMVPIFSESCGESYCSEAVTVPAKDIQAGSRIYVASPEGTFVQTVSAVSSSSAFVRYVLTEAETMVVDGVVASVHSTLAGSLETLPFRFVDWMYRGSLQSKPIAAALAVVLESPALQALESFLNAAIPLLSRPAVHFTHAARNHLLPTQSF